MEKIDFALDDVLESIIDMFAFKAEEHGLELIFDIDREIPKHLIGDPLRLQQILTNLGNNSLKFTDEGEITIGARLCSKTSKHVKIEFSVKDTGIGMSEKQIAKLFTAFSQADSSTTRKYGGTGLGLSICKSLVGLMGGHIRVNSKIGTGSDFRFTAKFGVKDEAIPTKSPTHSSFNGLKVLVVDDNDTARDKLFDLLSILKIDADRCESGKMAIQMTRKAEKESIPYDIILTRYSRNQNLIGAILFDEHQRPDHPRTLKFGRPLPK